MFKWLKSLFKRKRRHCYYLHSSIHLPAPLDESEEERLLRLVEQENSIEARNVLIEHNLRLVVYIAKRFESKQVLIEDLISIGSMGLIKGVQTFKLDKNIKLATYASRCIENEILMYLRKHGSRAEVSIDEPLNVDWDGNELLLCDVLGSDEESMDSELAGKEEKRLLRAAVARLAPRERLIIELRFGFHGKKELTQKEVADLLGISQSYISRLEKKIIAELREELV